MPCRRTYPVYLGIPDFRAPDLQDGFWREEQAILPLLLEKYASATVQELLGIMLAGLEGKSQADRDALNEYYLGGLDGRSRHRMRLLDHVAAGNGRSPDFRRTLEVGCGTGANLLELAKRGQAVGIEPNLLHLVIAKKHAETLNLPVQFVCGVGEELPFPSEAFTVVHFAHTLEHFADQSRGLSEASRVLAPGGLAFFDIPNRYSLWREPHTRTWGIGFLPRRLTALSRIKNQSLWTLRRLVRAAFGEQFRIHTVMVRFEVAGYERGALLHAVASLLRAVERLPAVGTAIRFLQPGFEVVAWKASSRGLGREA